MLTRSLLNVHELYSPYLNVWNKILLKQWLSNSLYMYIWYTLVFIFCRVSFDMHAWYYMPLSFRRIIEDDMNSYEFISIALLLTTCTSHISFQFLLFLTIKINKVQFIFNKVHCKGTWISYRFRCTCRSS